MIIKKIVKFISLLTLISSLWIPISQASANTFVPDEIAVSTQPQTKSAKGVPVFKAGTLLDIDIMYSEKRALVQSKYEIGVAREIKRGYLTYYESMASFTVDAEQIKNAAELKVPNIAENIATSTFVAFVKLYTPDNPDAEKFFVTDPFMIEMSDEKFVSVQSVNLLQSNGKRFDLLAGPHIYDPAKESAVDLATSTNVEITFISNTDTTLRPTITFKKLRSNVFSEVVEVNPIEIKKGENYQTISLPTFDYEPGVYTGEMVFQSDLIRSSVQFQYIVAGDAVTVGQVFPVITAKGTEVMYEIFGVPLDLERLTARGEKPEMSSMYDVSLIYKKGDKDVFSEVQKVDFSTSSFTSIVPPNIRVIDSVDIKVVSNNGATVYEGTKSILVAKKPVVSLPVLITIGALLVLLIVLLIIKHKKVAVPVAILCAGLSLIFVAKVSEAVWNPEGYLVAFDNSVFRTELASEYPRLYFNDDLSTKTFSLGENLNFMFKMTYLYCANTNLGIEAGFSTISLNQAISNKVEQDWGAVEQTGIGNTRGHPVYRNTTAFVQASLGPITSKNTTLHAVVYHDIYAANQFAKDGYSHYSIPLKIGPSAPVVVANTSAECGGKVNLNWEAVSGVGRYDIYVSETSGGTYTKVGSSETTAYVHTSGIASKTYYFKVRAIDATSGLESSFSNTATANTSADCGTENVAALSCSANPNTVGTGVDVTWAATVANGNPADYTYTWSGAVTGTNQTETTTYQTFGNRTAQVAARSKTDAAQVLTTSCSVSVSSSSCSPSQTYCSTLNACISTGESCPQACGTATQQPVGADKRLTMTSANLCGSGYSVLPGSLFGTPGRRDNAWQWVCAANASDISSRVYCSADCASGTSYCPATNTCATTCDSCPAGYALDESGACIPPNGRIIYFRVEPDTSEANCPAYWDTEVDAAGYAKCSIGSMPVEADNLIGSASGFSIPAGTRATLRCEIRTKADDSVIKTLTETIRCFKPTNVIEN